MLYRVIDDNGTKKKEPLTGIGYGMPLGAVVVLEDTTHLPDGYLLCDGSTFDETVYPALYAYLGTNVLPEIFDHSKPSAYRSQTVTYTSATAQTASTDMDVIATMSSVSTSSQKVYVNDVDITTVNAPLSGQACTASATFSLRKGDTWYITRGSTSVGAPTAAVIAYEQYKAIKATPAGSGDISDVGALITRNASYSTDETLTGGTWIDDKPIYRKVFTWPNVGLASGWNNVIEITNDFNPETLVNARWLTTTSGVGVSFGFFRIYNGYIQFYSPGVTWETSGAILEYTKV